MENFRLFFKFRSSYQKEAEDCFNDENPKWLKHDQRQKNDLSLRKLTTTKKDTKGIMTEPLLPS